MKTVGQREIWHSLRTEPETEAFRRSHSVLAQIEVTLPTARSVAGKNVDPTLLERSHKAAAFAVLKSGTDLYDAEYFD